MSVEEMAVILGGEAGVQPTGWHVLPPTAGTKEGTGGPWNVPLISSLLLGRWTSLSLSPDLG